MFLFEIIANPSHRPKRRCLIIFKEIPRLRLTTSLGMTKKKMLIPTPQTLRFRFTLLLT